MMPALSLGYPAFLPIRNRKGADQLFLPWRNENLVFGRNPVLIWLRKPLGRRIAIGLLIGLFLAIVIEAGNVLVGSNFHILEPGRVYRCDQPSAKGLEKIIKTYGIRTVVNLRGCCPWGDWYLDECRLTQQMHISLEDIGLSVYRLPSVSEMRRLIEVLDRTEYPILLHCRRGADRTGLASAVVMLLQSKESLPKARQQLGLRYGHIALGRPANLDRFFDLYEAWLAKEGLIHSQAIFRRWIEKGYCPGCCFCTMDEGPGARVPCGRPFPLHLHCRNSGSQSWRLRPEENAGYHAGFTLYDSQEQIVDSGRLGLFDTEISPGQTVDLTLVLPTLKIPGCYRLVVDMVDEDEGWFSQLGSEPLEQELEACEQDPAAGH